MKIYFILIAFLTILICCGKDENLINPTSNEFYDVIFDKTYDLSTGASEPSDIIETSQGGYLVAGRNKTGTTNQAAFLRLDKDGNKLWDKTFNNGWIFCSVIEVMGSGYLAVGDSRDSTYMVRTDYSGNIIWEAYNYFQYSDMARKVIQTSDGAFLIIINSYETHGSARLVKLNDNGVKVWVKIIQGEPALRVYSVYENADSTLSLIATSKTYAQPESWYITLDKNGNELRRKSLSQSVAEIGTTFFEFSVCQNSLGYYAASGMQSFFLFDVSGDLIIKSTLQPQTGYDWLRLYTTNTSLNNEFVAAGFQSKNVIVGSTLTSVTTGSLFLFSSSGEFLKAIVVGDSDSQNAVTSVITSDNNSFVITGYKTDSNDKEVFWVKKLTLK
jgi:hypothetical protein